MTPGTLLAVMVTIWLALLAGLWRVAARLEQTDRRIEGLGRG